MIFRASAPCPSLASRLGRVLLLLALAAAAALPQRLSIGLKAGVPFNDLMKSESWKGWRYQPDSSRVTVGPMIEVLVGRLSLELDALYRPVRYRAEMGGAVSTEAGTAWQFPLVAKIRLSRRLVAPYVAGGVTFNHLSDLKDVPELSTSSASGWVLGLGLEGRLPIVRLSPELRYTNWRKDSLSAPAGGPSLFNRNQIEALVGITF